MVEKMEGTLADQTRPQATSPPSAAAVREIKPLPRGGSPRSSMPGSGSTPTASTATTTTTTPTTIATAAAAAASAALAHSIQRHLAAAAGSAATKDEFALPRRPAPAAVAAEKRQTAQV